MNSSGKSDTRQQSELQENLNLLRQTYFFSGLPLETLKLFAYLCRRENFKGGEYLFKQGEDDGQALYIVEGSAVLERSDNGESHRVRDYGEGDFIGGLTLLGDSRRLFSLKAAEETTCLILNREKFTKALAQFPEIMPKIFKAVAGKIDSWESRFLNDRADQCGQCIGQLGVSLI
jgi:CRP-like cAMP-binding protein